MKNPVKQRNRYAVLAHFRRAGTHTKPFKALRKKENQKYLGV